MSTRLVTPDGRLGLRRVRGGYSVMDMRTRAETFLSSDGLRAFVAMAERDLAGHGKTAEPQAEP